MPTGFWPKSAGGLSGTIEVTGIAINLGKIANGSFRVTTTVVSLGAASPVMAWPLPAA